MPCKGSNVHIAFTNEHGRVGEIRTNGPTTHYGTTSDYRLKENVQPISNGLEAVQRLRPITYTFISDPATTLQGFLAHEVQEVVPQAVFGVKDEFTPQDGEVFQYMDSSQMVPMITAGLKDLIAEVAQLRAQVASLVAAP
jgi:hypothetical protein